jgi:hypothetical protein
MWVLIFILISLGGGIYLGYRFGVYFVRKENIILQRQLQLLQGFSNHWAAEATDKQQLSQKIAEQQSNTISSTMGTVIQLLHSLQAHQSTGMNSQEKAKVESIINQVKNNFSLDTV